MKIIVTDIEWDVDDERDLDNLPTEATLEDPTDEMVDEMREDGYSDSVTDCLSNTYGFCVKGYAAQLED